MREKEKEGRQRESKRERKEGGEGGETERNIDVLGIDWFPSCMYHNQGSNLQPGMSLDWELNLQHFGL